MLRLIGEARYLQHESPCHEKMRLIARMRLLNGELDTADSVLKRMQGADGENWLLRQFQGYKRALADTDAAYNAHVSQHGC
jgi:hypothetical protein